MRTRPPPVTQVKRVRPGPKVVMLPAPKHIAQRYKYTSKNRPSYGNPRTGMMEKGVRMNFSIPWATIKFSSGNVLSIPPNSAGGADSGGQLYMIPYNAYYFPGMVFNQVRNWQYYRFLRHRMRFTSRFGSSVNATATCAYYNDPNALEASGLTNGTTLVPETTIQYAACCTRWPLWRNMECMSYAGKPQWMVTAGVSNTAAFSYADTAANDRLTVSGVYAISVDNNPTPGKACTAGDIYLDFTIELKEMAAPATAGVTFFEAKHDRLVDQLRLQQLAHKLELLKLQDKQQETQISLLEQKHVPTVFPKESAFLGPEQTSDVKSEEFSDVEEKTEI